MTRVNSPRGRLGMAGSFRTPSKTVNGGSMTVFDSVSMAAHPTRPGLPAAELPLLGKLPEEVRGRLLESSHIERFAPRAELFGDGRGLVAALSLGADGISMGTRFCATREAPIHDNVKAKYVENDERDSFLIFRNLKNTARVGRSAVSEEVVRRLARPGAVFDDVKELVAGTASREVLKGGDLSKGLFWAGMVQALIHDIPSCSELIERIVAEAEAIVANRLGRFTQSA